MDISVWWKYITGPSRYLKSTYDAWLEMPVIIINAASEGELRELFYEQLEYKIRLYNNSYQVYRLSACDYKSLADNLLKKFGKASDVCEYRPAKHGSCAEYIAKINLLQNRTVIITGISSSSERELIDFTKNFGSCATHDSGSIILEFNHYSEICHAKMKGVSIIKWQDYYTEYDMYLFASLCASYSDDCKIKPYIAYLAAMLADGEPDLCSDIAVKELVGDIKKILEIYVSKYQRVAFLLSRDGADDLHDIIWQAQLHVLLPLIEEKRKKFISKYKETLSSVLPIKDDYEKEITRVEEMELRHISFYIRKNSLNISSEDCKYILMLWNTRNALAHSEIINADVLKLLLS